MSKTKEDKSRVIVEIDGKQAINNLGKLEMEAKQLAVDLKNLKKGTKEYVEANKRLKEAKVEIEKVRQELGLTGMTMTQLVRYQRDLRKEISNTATAGTQKHRELKKSYQDVTAEIARQRKELNGNANAVGGINSELKKTPGFFSDIKKELKTFSVIALGALGVSEFFAGIQNLIKGSAKLSDAYADVQKTTGLTKVEVEQLNRELKKMDTRTPRSELLKLAADAGKLGIAGRKDILDFVNGADKINVALGEDLGEDAIKSIGKLNELFGYREIYGYGESMLKAGSAINELGANSAAQESYIVGFTARLGGAAKQAKITMMDIMGLGATLDALGQQEETSSTAVGMFLVDMFKDTSTYAKIAGMSVKEFGTLLNTDANEALIKVLEGLNGNNEGFGTMVKKLQEVGVEGSRGTQIISALAGNTKMLREQQAIANKAFEDGTSVLNEFNTKNENFAGNLEKIQKWMAGFFVNGGIMNGLNNFVGKWAEWIKIPLSSKMEDERISLNKLYLQVLQTNTSSEDRIKLINQMKEIAPDTLKNLDAETVSNQELAKAVKIVNDQLVNKIILQRQDEAIETRNRQIGEKKLDLFNQEDKVRGQMIKLAEKYQIEIKEAASVEEMAIQVYEEAMAKENEMNKNRWGRGRLFDQIGEYGFQIRQMQDKQRALNGLEEGGNKLLDQKNALLKRLGITMEENLTKEQIEGRAAFLGTKPPENPNPQPFVDPVDPKTEAEAKKARDKAQKELEQKLAQYEAYLIKIRDLQRDYEMADQGGAEAEILKVEYQYEALEQSLKTHLDNKTITQQEYDAKLHELQEMELAEHNRIYAEYAAQAEDERKAAEQKILEATTEEKELAILKTNQLYDELLSIARLYGLETVSIETARRAALEEVQKKFDKKEIAEATKIAEAKQMIARGLSESIGAVIDFIGNKQGELTAFQKVLTGAQIAIDMAASLGKIIPLAIEAASGTGPAAPFVMAGYIAAMAGTVLGAIARAKNALSDADTPEWNSSGDKPNTGRSRPPQVKPKKSFFFGGFTGDQDLGTGDRYGKFAGWVHQNEYVMSESVMQEPFIANLLPAIEAIRQDRVNGFSGGSQSGATVTATLDPQSAALIKETVAEVKRMKKEMKAYIVLTELEEAQDERSYLEKRYRAD
jgi:TP901 family phage tail tape measure protein